MPVNSHNAGRPRVAVTMGDPGGIGPEVIVKALADPALRRQAHFRVYGPAAVLEEAAASAEIDPYWWKVAQGSALLETTLVQDVVVVDYPRPDMGIARQPTRAQGELSFRLVEDAIAAAKRPERDPLRVDAIVTGPISKAAWGMAGRGQYPGHTELLALRFGAKRHGMLFVSPKPPHLRVILATAHVPLMEVRNVLTIGKVFDAIDLGDEALKGMGISRPRIAVCGLNPHAGEGGMLGDEDERIVAAAIRVAADGGIDARGPFPADTIYNAAVRGEFDLVVAMYHDQGLIPVKLLAWDSAVNVTVGLPVVRTSPDHGTAFDIAGKNKANPGSMRAALELAVGMAGRR